MEDLGFWEKGGNQLDGPVKNVEVEQSMKFLDGLTDKSNMKPTHPVLDDWVLICWNNLSSADCIAQEQSQPVEQEAALPADA